MDGRCLIVLTELHSRPSGPYQNWAAPKKLVEKMQKGSISTAGYHLERSLSYKEREKERKMSWKHRPDIFQKRGLLLLWRDGMGFEIFLNMFTENVLFKLFLGILNVSAGITK